MNIRSHSPFSAYAHFIKTIDMLLSDRAVSISDRGGPFHYHMVKNVTASVRLHDKKKRDKQAADKS